MKKLKNKIAFVLLFILVSAMSQAKGLDPRFQILPLPQNIEILKGQGIAGSELAYIVSKGESKIPVLGTLLDALPRIEKQGTRYYTFPVGTEHTRISGRIYAGDHLPDNDPIARTSRIVLRLSDLGTTDGG